MDFRAVLICLCLHIAQASCQPVSTRVRTGAVNATIQVMRGEIRSALDHLAAPSVLPNIPCVFLNATELLGPEQQQIQLRPISCYLVEISKLIPELSTLLKTTSQDTEDVELLTSSQGVKKNCSLPTFEQHLDGYVHAKCLLQLLHERLSKAVF